MKKLAVLTLVISMLALSVVPALAAGGPPANAGTGSGNCTGDQQRLGSGYQGSLGTGYQVGFGVRNPFALSGIITDLDTIAKTVTVEVSCGNRLVAPFIGTEVTLETIGITRFLLRSDDGSATPISFDELEVGQPVSSHGYLVDNVFTATRVTMGALLYCLP